MNSSEVIIYGIKRQLIWDSPDKEYYKGVKIQRFVNGQWQSAAEYPRENDPGRFLMQPGVTYRVVSLWLTGSKFFSAQYPTGTYLGGITEIVEEGVFTVTDLEHDGFDSITIEDRVETDIDVKMVAPAVSSLDIYLPTLNTLTNDDISYSPTPGSKIYNETLTITDVYMPTLLTMDTQIDTIYSPLPGAMLYFGNLEVVRYSGGSVINIGG